MIRKIVGIVFVSVAEPHHFYGAAAPGKNFDAAPAATAHTPYCIARQNFKNELKFKHMLKLSCSYMILYDLY
jgi:hypothetical protein